jgi:hypothetical protein
MTKSAPLSSSAIINQSKAGSDLMQEGQTERDAPLSLAKNWHNIVSFVGFFKPARVARPLLIYATEA